MINLDIEIDEKEFLKRLGDMDNKMPQIARKMMNRVNAKIKSDAKKEIKSRGWDTSSDESAYKNLFSKSSKKFTAIVGMKKAAYKSSWNEHGANPTAKNGQYLTFQINGEWKKVEAVTIPARPFLAPQVEKYWGTGKAKEIMETVFQKELDKLFEGK